MDVTETSLPGVKLLSPPRFADPRGYFAEIFNRRTLLEVGVTTEFVQENHSYSKKSGTLRGLHFQGPPAAQTKLLRVLTGAILDICVDLRHGSPTFGRHEMIELSAGSGRQVLCPKGFAHGTLTLEPHTEIAYKVDAYYAPELEFGLCFDDPDLAINWPMPVDDMILSKKDRHQPRLCDLPPIFTFS